MLNSCNSTADSLRDEVVWVNVSPSLRRFDQAAMVQLSKSAVVSYWQYEQEADEACSLANVIAHLHTYLTSRSQPVHLVGHGLSGSLACLYARQHPEQVRSLTLLAVAAQPAINWHSHYYTQRHLLPCSQVQLLTQIAISLFGRSLPCAPMSLVKLLAKDLAVTPSPHSLYSITTLPKGCVSMPLLVCGSQTDFVITPPLFKRWTDFFKPGDTLWQCEDGHHFFHHYRSDLAAQQLLKFWHQTQKRAVKSRSLIGIC